mgnify:CR=1 FL=1
MTYVAGSFSITKAAATVTAGGGTKAHGTADPAHSATATGFTAADALTIALSRDARASGETVGDYVTTATATGAALTNYTVTYVAGQLQHHQGLSHGDGGRRDEGLRHGGPGATARRRRASRRPMR